MSWDITQQKKKTLLKSVLYTYVIKQDFTYKQARKIAIVFSLRQATWLERNAGTINRETRYLSTDTHTSTVRFLKLLGGEFLVALELWFFWTSSYEVWMRWIENVAINALLLFYSCQVMKLGYTVAELNTKQTPKTPACTLTLAWRIRLCRKSNAYQWHSRIKTAYQERGFHGRCTPITECF